ncbi:MAG: phage tail tape measure protein, partial [Candidatus Poribacteria bacterium]|nr:phage tail tape measure protein [Candidatus Poribacteria bacterium]
MPVLKQDIVVDIKGIEKAIALQETLDKLHTAAAKVETIKIDATGTKKKTEEVEKNTKAVEDNVEAKEKGTKADKDAVIIDKKVAKSTQERIRHSKDLSDNRMRMIDLTESELDVSERKAAVEKAIEQANRNKDQKELPRQKKLKEDIRLEENRNKARRQFLDTERKTLLATKDVSRAEERQVNAKRRVRAAITQNRVERTRHSRAVLISARAYERDARAALRDAKATEVNTAATKKNLLTQSGFFSRLFAGGAGQFGSVRTMVSSAAFHVKSLGLFGGIAAFAALSTAIRTVLVPSIKFEKQMAMVRKTTGLTSIEIKQFGEDLRDLSVDIGVARDDLAQIAEIAGQMGIRGEENLLRFIGTVGRLASVAELAPDKAAKSIAKISQAFQLNIDDAENLGSVIN